MGASRSCCSRPGNPCLCRPSRQTSRAPARWKALPTPGFLFDVVAHPGRVRRAIRPGLERIGRRKSRTPAAGQPAHASGPAVRRFPSYRASVPRVWAATGNLPVGDGPTGARGSGRYGERRATKGYRVPEPGVVMVVLPSVMLDANMPPMKTALGRPPAAPETTPPARISCLPTASP